MPVAVSPLVEFLDNPGSLANGRVRQPIAQSLRSGCLLLGIAGVVILVKFEAGQSGFLQFAQVVHGLGVGRNDGHGDMDALAVAEILRADHASDDGAPVAALGKIMVISQTNH